MPAANARLASEVELLRSIVDRLEDGVVVTSQSSKSAAISVLYANPAFLAACGAAAGDSPATPGEKPDLSELLFNEGALAASLCEGHRSDGVFWADVIVQPSGGERAVWRLRSEPLCVSASQSGNTHRVNLVRDVTRQTALEDALHRNERLANIGLLAAGIVHEINNPTGSALLAAETALSALDDPESRPRVAACLKNIVTSLERCGRIVRSLLRYSREEPAEKQACSINDVARQVIELSRSYAEQRGAELRLELAPDVPLAPMNPLEIELVLVNLIRNAVEAGEGCVAVTLQTQQTENSVQATVADTGCGMTPAQLAHVFDPLYTTRRGCGGSGLGMSIAQRIVQAHAGRMEVRSQPDCGTAVVIDLPIAAEQPPATEV